MSAQQDIVCLLERWREITRSEAEAIQADAWTRLEEIQSRKASLQKPLDEALEKWRMEETAGVGNPFRAELSRLIALEAHHAQLVASRRQQLHEQHVHLDRAAQNLRRVRQTYVALTPMALNSYS